MTPLEPRPASVESAETILLGIDLQPAFIAALSDGQKMHWRCSFALEAARGFGLPVLFTEQVPAKLGGTAVELLALADRPVVMAKDSFSALGDAAIAAHLLASGAKHLLLTGLETPVCVYQTAVEALRSGYQVTLLSDCLGARRAGDAAAALVHLARAGCAVLPAETVFYSRLKGAQHPFFRRFTALVKKYG